MGRLRERINHPTIKTPEQALGILARFSSTFQPPSPHEGYHRIMNLRPSDHPALDWTKEEVIAVLQQLRDSLPVISDRQTRTLPQFWGSRGTAFNRGSSHRGHARGYPPRGRGSRGHAPQPSSLAVDPNWSNNLRSRGGLDYSSHPRANHIRASWSPRAVQPPPLRDQSFSGPCMSAVSQTREAEILDLTRTLEPAVDRNEVSQQPGEGRHENETSSTSGGNSWRSGSMSGSGSFADPLVLE